MISIIIPTITGREGSLAVMMAAFRELTPFEFEFITPKDHPTWASACNAGQRLAAGDVLLFSADDLEPLAGWAEAMLATLEAGEIPAPQVWNNERSGPPVNEAEDGHAGSVTGFTRIPALTRAMAEAIGPWPETLHYYADNWVSDKGRLCGFQSRVTEGYGFIHHWHPVGRLDAGDWIARWKPLYDAERVKLGIGAA